MHVQITLPKMKPGSQHRQSNTPHVDELHKDVKPTKPVTGSSTSKMSLMQPKVFLYIHILEATRIRQNVMRFRKDQIKMHIPKLLTPFWMSPKSSTPFIQTTARDSGWEPENIALLSITAYMKLLPQEASLPIQSKAELWEVLWGQAPKNLWRRGKGEK